MRSFVLAALLVGACSSNPAADDLGASELDAAADLVSTIDLAVPADLTPACGPACATADFVAMSVAPSCGTAMMQGSLCNRGTVAGATTIAFYFLQTGDSTAPGDVSSQAMLVCTVKTVALGPGACTTTGCAPPAGWTGTNIPTGDYWLRVNDDGQSFPLAPECCTGDDTSGEWVDCSLP